MTALGVWPLIFQAVLTLCTVAGGVVGWRKLRVDVRGVAKDETSVWLQDNARLRQAVAEGATTIAAQGVTIAEQRGEIADLRGQILRQRGEIDGLQGYAELLQRHLTAMGYGVPDSGGKQ